MTYDDEYINRLIEEREKAEQDRDAQYMPTPADPPGMASEENFKLIAGIDEIPDRYKEAFPHLAAPTNQWMNIKSIREQALWEIRGDLSIDYYCLTRPFSGLTIYDKSVLLHFYNKNLNRSWQAHERGMTTASTSMIVHQQISPNPNSGANITPKKQGLGTKIASMFGGRQA